MARRILATLSSLVILGGGVLWGVARPRADDGNPAPVAEAFGDLLPSFELNVGQSDPRVDFLARGSGYSTLLGDDGPTFALEQDAARSGAAVRMALVGGEGFQAARGIDPLPGTVNYFMGRDPTEWRTGVPTYASVRYEDVYPGTDLVFRGAAGTSVEYDFVLEPGADPARIGMRFEGARGLRLDDRGDLVVTTAAGDLVHRAPTVYQVAGGDRVEIDGRYVLDAGTVLFDIGPYDPSIPLVIDPVVVVYSTFLGGNVTDNPFDIAVDGGGNAYVVGYTFDSTVEYPVTPGAFDTTHNNSEDVFVSKLSPDGSSLVYSTFLGAGVDDYGFDIAVDASGATYVAGTTFDAAVDFPTTPGAYDTSHNGGSDVFVTKLAPSGASLVYSTLLGGDGFETAFGLAIDGAGSAFVIGQTSDSATDFPTTPGAYDEMHNGSTDAFLGKLTPSGTALAYSTFLGGSSSDQGVGIAVDGSGAAYVSGETTDGATDYPTTPGAFDEFHNGSDDAFLTKVAPSGALLLYSTFLGGSGADSGYRVAVDGPGAAYVTGRTFDGATDYPSTPGAFDTSHNGLEDAFVTKVAPSGSSLDYSTFLGGSDDDSGRGITVDPAGAAAVTGRSDDAATQYPTTAGAIDPTHNGGSDVVVTRLTPDGSALLYSTFLGGDSFETGWGVAFDAAGAFYVTGETSDGTPDYPTTPGAFDTSHNGVTDGFVTKLADPGTCRGKPVTILGTLSADTLSGTSGPDVFSALAGDDVITGLGDKDVACTGDGTDLFSGGPGKDIGVGGIGNDTLKGAPGRDRLFGEQGKDRLRGGGGNDRLNGGPGKDTCAGGGGEDKASKCEKERSVP